MPVGGQRQPGQFDKRIGRQGIRAQQAGVDHEPGARHRVERRRAEQDDTVKAQVRPCRLAGPATIGHGAALFIGLDGDDEIERGVDAGEPAGTRRQHRDHVEQLGHRLDTAAATACDACLDAVAVVRSEQARRLAAEHAGPVVRDAAAVLEQQRVAGGRWHEVDQLAPAAR